MKHSTHILCRLCSICARHVAESVAPAGISTGLQLDAPTLSNIYSCQITTWNDPAIQALNTGTKCGFPLRA